MGKDSVEITFLTFLWGNWPHGREYVGRLRDGIARNCTKHFRFVLMADLQDEIEPIAGVDVIPLLSKTFPRNLRKLDMYRLTDRFSGRVVSFDLDTVIVGNIDFLAEYSGEFAVLEDLWEPSYLGGGITMFEANTLYEKLYRPALVHGMDWVRALSKGGGERHWYRAVYPMAGRIQGMYPGMIVDAKPEKSREIIHAIPHMGRIACFHGLPRPHEVERDWLTRHWGSRLP